MTITLPWADVNNKKVCAQSVLELFDQINASCNQWDQIWRF